MTLTFRRPNKRRAYRGTVVRVDPYPFVRATDGKCYTVPFDSITALTFEPQPTPAATWAVFMAAMLGMWGEKR